MKGNLYLKMVLLCAVLTVFSGCATTTLLTSWSDSSAKQYSLKKPLVVSIVQKPLIRKKLEDGFVQRFREIGIEAVPSYTVFENISALAPDPLKGRLPSLGCDSILVVRLLDVKQETVHVPARTDVYGGPAYYGSYGGYYSRSVSVVSTPAYNYVEKVYLAETNIYDAVEGKLVWTGATETEDTASIDKAITEFTQLLMKDIRAKAIF
jgi:hypothetical protein